MLAFGSHSTILPCILLKNLNISDQFNIFKRNHISINQTTWSIYSIKSFNTSPNTIKLKINLEQNGGEQFINNSCNKSFGTLPFWTSYLNDAR